jgi:hypothetical protein
MATAETATDPGILADNGQQVRMLQQVLSQTDGLRATVPKVLGRLIRKDAWRDFLTVDGQHFRWNAADFRRFLEAPRPSGCQTPVETIERILKGTEAWEAFLELTRGERGGCHLEGGHNPEGLGGRAGKARDTLFNRDIITVEQKGDDSLTTLPIDPLPAEPKRDYAREAPTGTSLSYTFRRLKKEAPELAAKVMAGETSANAAAVAAGFRERKVTVPYDPARAARILVKHLGRDAARALADELHAATGE